MSPTFQHLAPRTETTYLQDRVHRLRASMDWASEAIPPSVRGVVFETIKRCEERLALGVDHTIAALAGGTGSGKSSIFNALVGSEFALPGVARPTTSEVSAATWDAVFPGLLDWLEVPVDRRLALETIPDQPDSLEGLVLLDLPDHDSIQGANRQTVDRVVPMADLLLWVVDPQKYADHALHSAYLRVASENGQPSLVLLNQTDKLGVDDARAVASDLAGLLAADGLGDVPVLPISARTGEGMDQLRAELTAAVQSRTVAARSVRADLVAAGVALAGALSRDAEPELPDVEHLVDAIAHAAGVDSRADAVAAVVAGKAASVPASLGVPRAVMERERLDWVDAATAGLPVTWRTVVGEAVTRAPALTENVNGALALIDWPEVTKYPSRLRRGAKAKAAAQMVRAIGRDTVRSVVMPEVVDPTAMIHEAYRALDELSDLE